MSEQHTLRLFGNTMQDIELAAMLLKQGKLVAFPTETVYGLGASAFNPEALRKVFEAKGRPADNPLIAHISSIDELELLSDDVSNDARKLAEAFFPGPLTIVLPAKSTVPKEATGGLDTIAVRMPNHPIALSLLSMSGPLCAPSANVSGRPSPTNVYHVLEDLDGKIDAVLDGGQCTVGIESTVVRLTPTPMILRPGMISAEEIEKVLGKTVGIVQKHEHAVQSPGMKYRHYSPKAQLHLCGTHEEFEMYCRRLPHAMKMSGHVTTQFGDVFPLKESTYYDILRSADIKGVKDIIILFTEEERKQKPALFNRIEKALSKE
jgi:L-threonylcarbamoyladenylate synthase